VSILLLSIPVSISVISPRLYFSVISFLLSILVSVVLLSVLLLSIPVSVVLLSVLLLTVIVSVFLLSVDVLCSLIVSSLLIGPCPVILLSVVVSVSLLSLLLLSVQCTCLCSRSFCYRSSSSVLYFRYLFPAPLRSFLVSIGGRIYSLVVSTSVIGLCLY
jgi:hypothetical protein